MGGKISKENPYIVGEKEKKTLIQWGKKKRKPLYSGENK